MFNILMILLPVVTCANDMILRYDWIDDIMGKCVLDLVNKHFVNPKTILLLNYNNDLNVLHKNICASMVLSDTNAMKIDKSFDIVIILDNGLKWDQFGVNFWDFRYFAKNAKFIIISNERSLSSITECFWKMRILPVHVLVPAGNVIDVYSYSPFGIQNCSDLSAPKLLTKWNKSKRQFESFWNKETRVDLMKCPINISFMDFPPYAIRDKTKVEVKDMAGIEGNMMNTIADKLNFSARFINEGETGWGGFDPPKGLLGNLYTGRSDFAFGGLYPIPIRYEYLDAAFTHNFIDSSVFITIDGAAHRPPEWVTIFVMEFTPTFWLLVLLTYIISVIFSWILFKMTDLRRNYSIIKILAFFIGQSQRFDKKWTIRFFILSWTLFGFIITSAYQSAMSGRLTAPPQLPNINTLKELVNSDLVITAPAMALTLFNAKDDDETSRIMRGIHDKAKPEGRSIAEMLIVILKEKNVAFMHHEPILKYYTSTMKEVGVHIHFLEEVLLQNYPCILLQKNSFFTKAASRIISRLFDGGLFLKWAEDIFVEKKKKGKKELKSLNIERFYGLLIILCIGWVLSFLVFLSECLVKKLSLCYFKRKSRNVMRGFREE